MTAKFQADSRLEVARADQGTDPRTPLHQVKKPTWVSLLGRGSRCWPGDPRMVGRTEMVVAWRGSTDTAGRWGA